MSEAADAEREVEDFFNEQIFGAAAVVEADPLFPEGPPEAKPVSELVEQQEAPEEPEASEEEPDGEEEEGTPLIELDLGEEESAEDSPEEDPAVAWAKKQYGEDLDPEVLAKAAYEKEKMLGRESAEKKALREENERRELQARIDALNAPGSLTPDESDWVDEAVISGNPGEWAKAAFDEGRPDLFSAVLDRWATLGPEEARQARMLHTAAVRGIESQPPPGQQYALALGQTFASLGLDINTHGPLILQKLDELGSAHPDVQGMMSPDPNVRAMATRHIYDLISHGKTTVAKVKADDIVSKRVQEESLRQKAAGVEQGGPRIEQPKKSAFWEGFDEEIAERGWDGKRPTYGRD